MSEFFKALEQAERDRMRDEAEAASAPPASRATPREASPSAEATPKPEPRPVVREPVAAKPVAEPPATAPAAVKPAAQKAPAPPPAAPPPSRPVVVEPAAAAKPVVVEPAAAAKPAAVEPPAAPRPAAPRPAASDRPAAAAPAARPVVPKPLMARPASLVNGQTPAGVFRPSLQPQRRGGLMGRLTGRLPRLIAQTDPSSIEANAYRTVRANIELMSDNGPFRRIAVTSAAGGDGKSTTAANLAIVAAQGGRRVCLVDADLRRPTLHDVFGLPNVDGLAVALEHGTPLTSVAHATDMPNLSIVVAGRGADETFHDLVTPQRLGKVLAESEEAFDLVIFDTPPVISVADALNVAAVCDGVILVVRAGGIPFSVLRRTIGQVKQVKGRVLGVLLNQANLRATDASSYRYYRAHHTARPKS
jgi:capsular exopolysaccharide synthesis family protein